MAPSPAEPPGLALRAVLPGKGLLEELGDVMILTGRTIASAVSSFLTLGAKNVAYYRKVHGRRELFHVKGIILPTKCPRGGFPVASQFSFEDGSTVTTRSTVPCPPRH
jgi:hypothetical protein